jgi:hypothetical protein
MPDLRFGLRDQQSASGADCVGCFCEKTVELRATAAQERTGRQIAKHFTRHITAVKTSHVAFPGAVAPWMVISAADGGDKGYVSRGNFASEIADGSQAWYSLAVAWRSPQN